MFEQVFYLVIVAAGLIVALVTKDDTILGIVMLVGAIVIGFLLSLSLGMIIWIVSVIVVALMVSYAAADELHAGRRWFMVVLGISLVLFVAGIVKNNIDMLNLGGILALFSGISFAMSFTRVANARSSKI